MSRPSIGPIEETHIKQRTRIHVHKQQIKHAECMNIKCSNFGHLR